MIISYRTGQCPVPPEEPDTVRFLRRKRTIVAFRAMALSGSSCPVPPVRFLLSGTSCPVPPEEPDRRYRIDFGVEEIFEDEEGILIYGPFDSFGEIQKALESKEIQIISSGFDRIPNNLKNVNEEERSEIEKLLEKIENDDDVQNVFHNMNG